MNNTGKNRLVACAMRGCLFILCCGRFPVPLEQMTGNPRFFMDNNQQSNLFLLNLPIEELPLSEVFKLRSKLMNFFTLQDILSCDKHELILKLDYTEKWYFEFVNFLERKDLLDLLN